MATTTIRLSEEMKARVSRVAEEAGTTPHSFILEAIAEKTSAAERRADFIAEAHARYERILQGEPTLPWADVKEQWLATVAATARKKP